MSEIAEQQTPRLEELEDYVGMWVALRDGRVVASAASLQELRQNPEVLREDALYVVPEPSSYFY